MVKGLTEADYLKTIASYGDKYVLIDFNAVWCGPCKKLSPILDKVAEEKKDKLVLIKIDADDNPDLLQSKGIEGIPYLELYKEGKLVWSNKGLISEADLLAQTKL
jgi:thioredoxin 1